MEKISQLTREASAGMRLHRMRRSTPTLLLVIVLGATSGPLRSQPPSCGAADHVPVFQRSFDSPISQVVASPSQLLLSQPRSRQVAWMGADNAGVVRTLGRRGAGPGEFQSMYSLGFVDSSAWVYDGTLRRITIFSPSGTPTATYDLRQLAGVTYKSFWAVAVGAAGETIGAFISVSTSRAGTRDVPGPVIRVRPSSRSMLVDTLGELLQRAPLLNVSLGGEGVHAISLPELMWNDHIAGSPNGRWVVWTRHVRGRSGEFAHLEIISYDVARRLERRARFVPRASDARRTRAGRERYLTALLDTLGAADRTIALGVSRSIIEMTEDRVAIIHDLKIDESGNVWVRTTPRWVQPHEWIAIARDGSIVGELRTPYTTVSFQGQQMVAVCERPNGDESLVRRSAVRRDRR